MDKHIITATKKLYNLILLTLNGCEDNGLGRITATDIMLYS